MVAEKETAVVVEKETAADVTKAGVYYILLACPEAIAGRLLPEQLLMYVPTPSTDDLTAVV